MRRVLPLAGKLTTPADDDDRTGSVTAAHAEAPAPAATPKQRYPKLELLLQFGAAPAIVVYGLLFLAYRSYYSTLGVDPEDVGIDNAYILSRSAGFILVLGVFALFAALSQFVDQKSTGKVPEGWVSLAKLVLTLPFGLFLVSILTDSAPVVLLTLTILVGCIAQAVPLSLFHHFGVWASTTVYTIILILGLGVVATALISRANFSARVADEGCAVEPIQYASIPVLELSASPVSIEWVGPQNQRPLLFGSDASPSPIRGLLIGRGSTADYVLVDPDGAAAVLRVPTALTISRSDLEQAPRACDPAAQRGS